MPTLQEVLEPYAFKIIYGSDRQDLDREIQKGAHAVASHVYHVVYQAMQDNVARCRDRKDVTTFMIRSLTLASQKIHRGTE